MKITVLKNGPLLVSEACTVLDAETGEEIAVAKAPFALCRCGHSVNKPFCDGAHGKQGFEGACAKQGG
ncbi:MAG: CDGSH iron-sulfur domain-containing protein [Deltaproteobacteria bacterium]|nr:CDGSH iron-sulfur domain-containing protein [Deltaproteobacteria bacterium]